MKRPIFFIVSAILVLVLLIAWVYVLFFSDPPSTEPRDPVTIFPPGREVGQPEPVPEEPVVDLTSREKLRQLTLEPVIGFQEVKTKLGADLEIYYSVAGTGKIQSINLENGTEKRVSANTIVAARKSAITPNGAFALTQSGRGAGSKFFISFLNPDDENSSLEALNEKIVDFTSTTENTFLFTTKVGNSLVAKEYFPISQTSQDIFTVPFQEAVVDWGNRAADAHYIYPKPSVSLEGYLYKTNIEGEVERILPSGFGLSGIGNESYAVYANQFVKEFQTTLYNVATKKTRSFPINTLPEKCVNLNTSNKMVCATDSDAFSSFTPDEWYEGSISYSDSIVEFNFENFNLKNLSSTFFETGRIVDIINPQSGENDVFIYFQNKNDQTLWLYERGFDVITPEVTVEEEIEVTTEETTQ